MPSVLDQLEAAPGDARLFSVYQDELLERGDPRGELIAVQLERESDSSKALRERDEALTAAALARLREASPLRINEATYRRGFLDTLGLDLVDASPPQLLQFLSFPEARLVRRLSLEACTFDGHGDLPPFWVVLTDPTLRLRGLIELRVTVGPDLGSPWYEGPADIGDVRALYAAYPKLESLSLAGYSHRLGTVNLPALKTFEAWMLPIEELPAIAGAHWPRLETLILHLAYGHGEPDALFRPLLNATLPKSVKRIELHSRYHDYLVGAVPRSRLIEPGREVVLQPPKGRRNLF